MLSPGVKKPVRGFSELLDAHFWREYMHWGELADQAAPMLQPVGGMDRIVDGFMRQIGDAVELRAAVHEIRLEETGVEVAYTGPRGEVRAVRGDYCLNSMPAHLAVGLRHNLPARYVRALSAPGRGKLFKLAFQAKRRFWEDEHIYGGISWTNQDITQIWYPPHGIHGDAGVILGAYAFEDGPGGRLTGLSPAERVEAALAQGERVHADYRRLVDRGVSVAWYRMNHMLGCSTRWTDEAMRDHFRTLQNPVGRHYMVGDQISYHPGWQEGANPLGLPRPGGHRPTGAGVGGVTRPAVGRHPNRCRRGRGGRTNPLGADREVCGIFCDGRPRPALRSSRSGRGRRRVRRPTPGRRHPGPCT